MLNQLQVDRSEVVASSDNQGDRMADETVAGDRGKDSGYTSPQDVPPPGDGESTGARGGAANTDTAAAVRRAEDTGDTTTTTTATTTANATPATTTTNKSSAVLNLKKLEPMLLHLLEQQVEKDEILPDLEEGHRLLDEPTPPPPPPLHLRTNFPGVIGQPRQNTAANNSPAVFPAVEPTYHYQHPTTTSQPAYTSFQGYPLPLTAGHPPHNTTFFPPNPPLAYEMAPAGDQHHMMIPPPAPLFHHPPPHPMVAGGGGGGQWISHHHQPPAVVPQFPPPSLPSAASWAPHQYHADQQHQQQQQQQYQQQHQQQQQQHQQQQYQQQHQQQQQHHQLHGQQQLQTPLPPDTSQGHFLAQMDNLLVTIDMVSRQGLDPWNMMRVLGEYAHHHEGSTTPVFNVTQLDNLLKLLNVQGFAF